LEPGRPGQPWEPKKLSGLALEVYDKGSSVREKFQEALEDDFNTAEALGYLHELARLLNRILGDRSFRKDPAAGPLFQEGKAQLLEAGSILGLFQQRPAQYFADQQRRFLLTKGLKEEEIQQFIVQRNEARKAKNWAQADALRSQLGELGVILEDGPQGTTWRPA